MKKQSELDGMAIGDRMKRFYEFPMLYQLPRRIPVILRLDGKNFHTLAKQVQFAKPFDVNLRGALIETAKKLCRDIMNVQFVYLQSDEMSFLIIDYRHINQDVWYGNDIQKIVSVSSGLASAHMTLHYNRPVTFDARVFLAAKNDVCNYFIWRQRDWKRNSINMVARTFYKQGELNGVNTDQLQEKLWSEQGINWANLPICWKRGTTLLNVARGWVVDDEPLDFSAHREYINRFLPSYKEGTCWTENGLQENGGESFSGISPI